MLKISIPERPQQQLWDEIHEEFIYLPAEKGYELTLEHSLLSVSKWESIWCKPFLTTQDKSVEEILSYIECMTISPQNLSKEVYDRIPQSEYEKINKYINHPATATIIGGISGGGKSSSEIKTSEVIYYYMTACNIPFECQKWHLNRLLMLIRVCEIKNNPDNQKKLSANEIRKDYDALNEARRKKFNSKG